MMRRQSALQSWFSKAPCTFDTLSTLKWKAPNHHVEIKKASRAQKEKFGEELDLAAPINVESDQYFQSNSRYGPTGVCK